MQFLALRGLVLKFCFKVLLLHLMDRKSLEDNNGGVKNT